MAYGSPYPRKKKSTVPTAVWILGFIFLGCGGCVIFGLVGRELRPAAAPAAAPAATVDRSPEKQTARLKLIEEMIDKGIIYKVETPGSIPRVMVAPLFYELQIDTKKTFASAIWCYYYDGSNVYAPLNFHDGRSGKQIGYYSPGRGMKLD